MINKFLALSICLSSSFAAASTTVSWSEEYREYTARLDSTDSEDLWRLLELKSSHSDSRSFKSWKTNDEAITIFCTDNGERFESISCRITFSLDKSDFTEFSSDRELVWGHLEARQADLFSRVLPKSFSSFDGKVRITSSGKDRHFTLEFTR